MFAEINEQIQAMENAIAEENTKILMMEEIEKDTYTDEIFTYAEEGNIPIELPIENTKPAIAEENASTELKIDITKALSLESLLEPVKSSDSII